MPSFADSIFLFLLALLLFGPKKLPVLARELGKWMGEFRRASNEFKMQMEEELRVSEQTERQKQIAAMEAAAPIPPPLGEPAEPEHPHLRYASESSDGTAAALADVSVTEAASTPAEAAGDDFVPAPALVPAEELTADGARRPMPIATSGNLKMMPPATGLPTPRGRAASNGSALTGLVDAIPETTAPHTLEAAEAPEERVAHGD